jgi:integrase
MARQRANAPGPAPGNEVLMRLEANQVALTTPRGVRVERGIYQDPATGRYEITYTDSDGRQRWKTVTGGLREARRVRADVVSKLGRGERVAPSRQTFREVSEEWLATQTGGLRPRTKNVYGTSLRLHVYPMLGRVRVQDVDEDRIVRLLVELREKSGLAPGTIRGVLTPLGRVLGYATRRGLIPQNPARRLERGERPKIERREMRILDSNEIERLLAKALPNYRALLATAIFTGLRQGELLGLVWGDVALDLGIISVRKQLDRSGVRVVPKTSAAIREVEVFPALVQVLKVHRRSMLARGLTKPTDPVFSTETGSPMYWRNVSARGLEKAAERAGLIATRAERKKIRDEGGDGRPGLRFHDLRHTYASMLIGQGEDATYVAAQMGHASPKITLDVYARLFDRQRRAKEAKARMQAAHGALLDGMLARSAG